MGFGETNFVVPNHLASGSVFSQAARDPLQAGFASCCAAPLRTV